MDESMFDLDQKAKPTTKQGDPWLRWANVGSYSGWYAIGQRKPSYGDRLNFWEAVVTLATEVGNGNLDAVHCIGPGILSIGGLGVTIASGYAQRLLADCLEAAPMRFMMEMGPVIHKSGAWLATARDGGTYLDAMSGGPVVEREKLHQLVRRGGGDAGVWSASQKKMAKLWVEQTSRLLREPVLDQVQVAFCEKHIPKLLVSMRDRIGWPAAGIRDGWMYTPNQQALWCVIMVAALEDDEQTCALVERCVDVAPRDALKSLRTLYGEVSEATSTGTFVVRVKNAVRRSQEIFRINVL
jgi:hypothetical protein